nr:glycoside hydrolase family 88 protein [Ruminiclostridium cellobioparum]
MDWTSFWTGMLWLAYEVTGDERYRNTAEVQLSSYKQRITERICTDTHDLGFLYSLSCVASYKLTGNGEAKEIALYAAELLMRRYFDKAKIIQAWGDLSDPENRGRMIIDCCMNLPLLYWAAEITGDKKYFKAANYFLNRLPQDCICCWDLIFTGGTQERDSSAAAIAACGLLELSKHLPLEDIMKKIYENATVNIVKSLAEGYTSITDPKSNGILLHAVYSKPDGKGVDKCNIWGDYFYFEALVRLIKEWKTYW